MIPMTRISRQASRNTLSFLALIAIATLFSGCSSMGTAMKASPTLANVLGVATIPVTDLKRDYTNDESEFIEVNDYLIHYQDQGEGEPVILLHGIFSSLQTWDEWVPALAKHYRVITLDLPGYGLTGAPENLERFDRQHVVNTFARFVDELDLNKVSLVGNSFGGEIAAEYAAQYGNRVDKLILLAPFGYPQDLPWTIDFATFGPMAFISKYIQPPVFLASEIRGAYGDPRRLEEEDAFRYVHMSQRPGAKPLYSRTLEMIEARANSDEPRPYYRIGAPTLLMWGEEDHVVPLKLAEFWQNDIANTALITYPGVGHMPMEEFPEETVKDAIEFLENGLGSFRMAAPSETEGGTEVETTGQEGDV